MFTQNKTRNRIAGWLRRGLLCLLAAALLCGAGMASAMEWPVEYPVKDAPIVTVQGNAVLNDAGKPTGFFELAVMVQTRVYTFDETSGAAIPTNYTATITPAQWESLSATDRALYRETNLPFESLGIALEVNTDILTPVSWNVENVTYEDWDGSNYAGNDTGYDPGPGTPTGYGRGVKAVDGVSLEDAMKGSRPAVPNITKARQTNAATMQWLYAIGPDELADSTASVEQYSYNAGTGASTAVISMMAYMAPGAKGVFYDEATEVVVLRFAYDLKRFPNVKDHTLTGSFNMRRTNNSAGPKILAYMASDAAAAASQVDMALRYVGNTITDGSGSEPVAFWYYEHSEPAVPPPAGTTVTPGTTGNTVEVYAGGDVHEIDEPNTVGGKILTAVTCDHDAATPVCNYSYLRNLLRECDGSLRFTYENLPTYRKATGGKGGNMILFLDWDGALIGSLIVGNGDVRQDVNEYVEQNFIHPDLRASTVLNGTGLNGKVPDYAALGTPASGSDEEKYQNLTDSLAREYTYRGMYPAAVTSGVSYPEDGTALAGSNFPLTNKLDYAFYRHVHTVTEEEVTPAGKPTYYNHYYTLSDVSADTEAALYPYIYGWAIVEDGDNTAIPMHKSNWYLALDSMKSDSTWTTFGVGELANQDPAATASLTAAVSGTITANGSVTGGLANPLTKPVDAATAPADYAYYTSSNAANSYLKFADFSDLDAMLKTGQDVLVVKAVYEPGPSLLPNDHYTVVPNSLYVTRYGTNASNQASTYAFQYQYQRATDKNTYWQGVRRVRDPAVQTGFTYDVNAFDTNDNDLSPLSDTSVFYLQSIAQNKDIMDIELTAGGVIWRVEYKLLDLYGDYNIATGPQRSAGGELNLKNNFQYIKYGTTSDEWDYADRQGTNGYVVQATINQILEKATAIARKVSSENLLSYVTYNTVNDLNLRVDSAGTPFVRGDYSLCADAIQNLVEAIVQKYPDPASAPAGIYNEKDNVKLTWHQVQREVLMYCAGGSSSIFDGTNLMTDGACAGFPWCRFDDCASDVKMDINSVNDVLLALYYIQVDPTSNDAKKAQDALYGDGSTTFGIPDTFLDSSDFRVLQGVPYTQLYPSASNRKTALLNLLRDNVVDKIIAYDTANSTTTDLTTLSWTRIQDSLITGTFNPTAPITNNYWWDPAGTNRYPAINNWDDLVRLSYAALQGVDLDNDGNLDGTVPEGMDALDITKNPGANALMTKLLTGNVAAADKAGYDVGYLKMVEGPDETTAKDFDTAANFVTAWQDALMNLATLGNYNPDGTGGAKAFSQATWEEWQYALLNYGQAVKYKDFASIVGDPAIDYWWKDGGSPKLTVAKLLPPLAKLLFTGSAADLENLLSAGIGPINSEVYLRKTINGGEFDSVNDFKGQVFFALIKLNDCANVSSFIDSGAGSITLEWEELQWLLLNYNRLTTSTKMPDKATLLGEPGGDASSPFYGEIAGNVLWWKDGGTPTNPISITTINDVVLSGLWIKEGTLSNALDNLTAQILTSLGIRADIRGIPFATDADAIAAVTSAVNSFPYLSTGVGALDGSKLVMELQYAILNGNTYLPAASVTDTYWWHGTSGPPITSQAELLQEAWLYYIGDNGTVPEALDEMDLDFVTRRKNGGLALRRNDGGSGYLDESSLSQALQDAVTVLQAAGKTYDDMDDITQYELQYVLLNGAFKTETDVLAELAAASKDYWWFTSDNPPSSGPTRVEKPVSDSDLQALYDAMQVYSQDWDEGDMDALGLTVEYINDTLLLRKNAAGDKFDTLEEFYDSASFADLVFDLGSFFIGSGLTNYSSDYYSWDAYPTWEELQYVIIHLADLEGGTLNYPTFAQARQETEDDYDWKWEITGGGTTTTVEKPVSDSDLQALYDAMQVYSQDWDEGDMDALGLTVEYINDTLLLRKNAAGDKFDTLEEFYDSASFADLVFDLGSFFIGSGLTNYSSDYYSWDAYPTWEELQFAIIHLNELYGTKTMTMPTPAQARQEAEDNYGWKWETVTTGASVGPVRPGPVAKPLQKLPPLPAVSMAGTLDPLDLFDLLRLPDLLAPPELLELLELFDLMLMTAL